MEDAEILQLFNARDEAAIRDFVVINLTRAG